MQDLNIKSVNNGYQLVWRGDEIEIQVIENINDNDEETMTRMLTAVAEHFGYNYDKFSDKNLNISFDKKGHKVADEDVK